MNPPSDPMMLPSYLESFRLKIVRIADAKPVKLPGNKALISVGNKTISGSDVKSLTSCSDDQGGTQYSGYPTDFDQSSFQLYPDVEMVRRIFLPQVILRWPSKIATRFTTTRVAGPSGLHVGTGADKGRRPAGIFAEKGGRSWATTRTKPWARADQGDARTGPDKGPTKAMSGGHIVTRQTRCPQLFACQQRKCRKGPAHKGRQGLPSTAGDWRMSGRSGTPAFSSALSKTKPSLSKVSQRKSDTPRATCGRECPGGCPQCETMKGPPGIGDRDETTKKTVKKLPHPLQQALQPDEVVEPIRLPQSYRRRRQLHRLLHSEDLLSHLAQLKAAVMRDIIATELRKNHGAEATVGADKLVLTDYMSSEHSDCGELTHPEHEEYRAKTDNRCKETGKKSTAGRVKLTHFSAHPKNMNNVSPPTGGSQIPYEWMVDPGWKAKVEREQKDIPNVPNPPDVMIFLLPIPSDELDAGYMGDVEGSFCCSLHQGGVARRPWRCVDVGGARVSDSIYNYISKFFDIPPPTQLFSILLDIARARAETIRTSPLIWTLHLQGLPGIEYNLDWAPNVSAERGSVLPIHLCVPPAKDSFHLIVLTLPLVELSLTKSFFFTGNGNVWGWLCADKDNVWVGW
ncbi:hypothetical protein FB451DRAFT_1179106 [Mycena latifolia]|nr:hypothetical protein FB451DRAFT_1179106 [Mycena latifolia]